MAVSKWEKGKEIHAVSLISVKTCTFCWSIENFPEWPMDSVLTTTHFSPMPKQHCYATLRIPPDDSTCQLNFYSYIGEIPIKYILSITDSAGQLFLSTSNTIHTFEISKSKMIEFNDAAKDNILIFKVFMELRTFDCVSECYEMNPVSELDNVSALMQDLKLMYESSQYTDVSLKVDENSLPANKSILCARSPVFARMFETSMDEAVSNVVPITDLKFEVLKDLLEFLYTGSLRREDFESVYELYYAADKYDVPSLIETCRDVLVSNLKIENACRVLSLADLHSDNKLKDLAKKFINCYFEKILKTDNWRNFVESETRLAASVMLYCSEKFQQ